MESDFNEKRFADLRELSRDEQLEEIRELEDNIAFAEDAIDKKTVSGEQLTEFYYDLSNYRAKLEFLNKIVNEKQR